MEQLTLIGRAEKVIEEMPGEIVLVSDFTRLAAASQISRLLSAFMREGRLFRFMFQVYVKGQEDAAGIWRPASRNIPALADQVIKRLELPTEKDGATLSLINGKMSIFRGRRCLFSRDYELSPMTIPPYITLSRTKSLRVPHRESRWRQVMKEPLEIIDASSGNVIPHSILSKKYGIRKAGQIFSRLINIGAVESIGHGLYIKNLRTSDEWKWTKNPAKFIDLVIESIHLLGMDPKDIWQEAHGYAIKCSGKKSNRTFSRDGESARIFF